jgi:murein DD-endopeptidase MepM/ murein hydrolase activator NlpD
MLQPAWVSTVAGGPAPATSLGISTDPVTALPPSAVSDLLIPVVGVKADELVDTFTDARSQGRVHDAIDIMAARGTPVVAVNDGHVVKLFTSVRGGLTVYQFDPQDQVIYYYAHLDGYAPGLVEGQVLHRGDPIGWVGSTGNASAEAPHLHFEVGILGPKKRWWHATSINPYGRFAGQP